jgi:hypothetical protein
MTAALPGWRRALATVALALAGTAHAGDAAPRPDLRTDDVERFYRVYDAAQGRPGAAALQAGYLDPGSEALHQFALTRIGSAARLAEAIARRPEDFVKARACLSALASTRARLPGVFARMAQLHAGSTFPPITFVVGRGSTGGTTTRDGIVIGLETMCRYDMLGADVGDRFTHIIAHELAHVQQPQAQVDPPPGATLLFQSLLEGGAEFVAELTSGGVSYGHMKTWTRGKECTIEQAFAKDALGTDTSHWLYNGFGTPDKPGDLGYWVGYRIARAYYERAPDKTAAVSALLDVDNASAPAIFKDSGWTPQADCQAGEGLTAPTAASSPGTAAARTPAGSA